MTGIPWYYHAKTQIEKADGYLLHALMEIEKRNDSIKIISELDEYRENATYSLIFEHNRMEAAGLSRKETISLIQKWEGDKLALFKSGRVYDRLPESRRNSGDFSKQQKEVLQHFDTLIESAWIQMEYFGRSAQMLEAAARKIEEAQSRGEPISEVRINRPLLFATGLFKQLHKIISDGLIPEEWHGLQAGQYRNANCFTDGEMLYEDHQNIEPAMEKWVEESNAIMNSEKSPIIKAAHISHRFVTIHPFPDFNGRLSRIILNMVLGVEGSSFLVVLRGGAKDKHKYITAIKHANHGNLERYACLIARAVNEGFEQLNERLKLAGLEPITPAPKD